MPKGTTIEANARNLLVGAGAYSISRWIALPLSFGFGKLSAHIIYQGDLQTAVLAPLILHLGAAIIAFGTGACVVWLFESEGPLRWALFPVALFGFLGFFGYHWGRPPMLLDRVAQTVGALFSALTCFLGATVATRKLRGSRMHADAEP